MTEINDIVGEEIEKGLVQEQDFYESSDRDKLKTPPFVYVKRIERPGMASYQRQPKPANNSGRKKERKGGSKKRD